MNKMTFDSTALIYAKASAILITNPFVPSTDAASLGTTHCEARSYTHFKVPREAKCEELWHTHF